MQRVVGVVEPLHERDLRRRRGVAHLPGLVGVARRRLLGEDVFAGFDGGPVPRPVQRVGYTSHHAAYTRIRLKFCQQTFEFRHINGLYQISIEAGLPGALLVVFLSVT